MKSSNWTDACDGSRSPRTPSPSSITRSATALIAWISRHLFDRFTYTVRHGLIRGMKRRGGLGWTPALFSGAQTREEMFWRELLAGWHGGVRCRRVPRHSDAVLRFACRASDRLRAERNESCPPDREYSAQQADRTCWFASSASARNLARACCASQPGNGGRRELGPGGQRAGFTARSRSRHSITTSRPLPCPRPISSRSTSKAGNSKRSKAPGQRWMRTIRRCFSKCMARRCAKRSGRLAEIVAFLRDAGYTDILHVETGAAITPGNEALAAEGHLYCRYTPK